MDSDGESDVDDVAMASASRVAKRLVIVFQDMLVVHGQPSTATSEVLHHLNDALADNKSETASVSRATGRDNGEVDFTAASSTRIAGDVVHF